ncbi:PAS domain S-box-containing protein/diguanylate cyclase (GGDEF)-like protein [Thioalbus denitrificans]|uniref:PAS domain S-box-containing protein/diguanylate cyclase (GGDEF)-like protein n=1 Tax=Thioalbus denitrificans TaxID=547122 RepID=A0A369CLH4_9GAMM|nr:PAS domain S-box-containing protein/diguanylate cyclase (GGDEF)-like protein [Thioalbus denitrificans]
MRIAPRLSLLVVLAAAGVVGMAVALERLDRLYQDEARLLRDITALQGALATDEPPADPKAVGAALDAVSVAPAAAHRRPELSSAYQRWFRDQARLADAGARLDAAAASFRDALAGREGLVPEGRREALWTLTRDTLLAHQAVAAWEQAAIPLLDAIDAAPDLREASRALVAAVEAYRARRADAEAGTRILLEGVNRLAREVGAATDTRAGQLRRWRDLGIAVLTLVLLSAGWVVSRSITVPLGRLRCQLEAISCENLEPGVPLSGGGEFAELDSTLDRLAGRLQAARSALEARVRERTAALEAANLTLREEVSERRLAEERLLLASKVLESASEAVLITRPDATIIHVNPAFTQITGYSAEEAIGNKPNLMKSGRHDESFYRAMWESLHARGSWQGQVWDRRKDGRIYPKWLTINAVRNEAGELTHYVGLFSDITGMKENEHRLQRLAHHDPLTGLPNRNLFWDRLGQAMAVADRSGQRAALLLFDLDRFKQVNDQHGHPVGDALLAGVGERIGECVRKTDTVARLGGDEFCVVLSEVDERGRAARVAEKIAASLEAPLQAKGRELFISASVGIALYPDDARDAETLLRCADMAMYQAKSQGRGRHVFFGAALRESAYQRIGLERRLQAGLAQDRFRLLYQPQVHAGDWRISGFEALLRWDDPLEGLVGPDRFLAVAEEIGLIRDLGRWVLREACRQAVSWEQAGRSLDRIAVNLAPRQLLEPAELSADVEAALGLSGLAPERLALELTEAQLSESAAATLQHLRGLGVRVVLDNFGSGMTSLAQLRRMPIDGLKLDRALVRELPANGEHAAIATGIIHLARELGLWLVAEGVENAGQLAFLTQHGCPLLQGHYLAMPQPAAVWSELGQHLPGPSGTALQP